MTVGVVIPCYWLNDDLIKMTIRCVNSLVDTCDAKWLLVDDGSPAPYPEEVPWILELNENRGYAVAANAGMELIDTDIIIVANNDIEFLPGWFEAILLPLYGDYDVSMIRVTDSDGWETEEKITENDKFGSLFAMKREVYDIVGGFDERFRGYFSDLDYRKRIIESGFRIGKNHAGLVEHKGKATYKQADPEDKEYLKAMEIYREKWGYVD